MKWRILDTGKASARENMQTDWSLLERLDEPILHFYDWKQNSVTFGHFIEPSSFLNLNRAERWKLDLARRPTGGGITFHLTDFAFSVLVPIGHEGYHVNVMDNYAFVNQRIAKAITNLIGNKPQLLGSEPVLEEDHSQHFCMAKPTKFDVMWGAKKIGGGAQRRTKRGFLHQGSIFLIKPEEEFLQDLVTPHICQCIEQNSAYLFSENNLSNLRKIIKEEVIKVFLEN